MFKRLGIRGMLIGVMSAACMFFGYADTIKAAEAPYLGLDPSTVLENEEDVRDYSDVETYSSGNPGIQMPNSKKGIQGNDWMSNSDASSLGIKHVLLNMTMDQVMESGTVPFDYNGKTYYYNENQLRHYDTQIRALNQKGITVSVVLLVQDNGNLKEWSKLVYAPERGHNFYGLNTRTQEARDTWSALFEYLTQRYSAADCHIDNWILGNEVNKPNDWNWTGTLDLATNTKVYADSYVLLYESIQNNAIANGANPQAKAYISLDRAWTEPGTGIGSKAFLTQFALYLSKNVQYSVDWGVAFHPYAAVMDPTVSGYSPEEINLWGNNPLTPNSENAKYVTAANLNVLTDYIRNNYGTQHRVILSEQGFDAKGGEDYQAAGLAYTFYAGQMNDMVDAVIFRAWEDHPAEMGLQLGIKGRKAHKVFKYMDTDLYGGETAQCLKTIGISSWYDIFGQSFNMGSMGFLDVNSQDWYIEAVRNLNNNGIMTGLNSLYFGSNNTLDRGQFTTALYRAAGTPEQAFIARFPDVGDGMFYSIPISWGVQNNVISGYENGSFGVSDSITREQMATLMYRYAQVQGLDTSGRADLSGYGDQGRVSRFAREAVEWSVARGLIKGEGNGGGLNPQGTVSRAVAATILNRYLYE